jgi:translocation and assembly module TamB
LKTRYKILIGLAALIVALLVTSILVVRSGWFSNFVREKIVAVVEDSTGGTVEIGSFQFDWSHLTVRIRNFVLHGREPHSAHPLVRVPLLELRLKLLSGFKKMVDLRYLGIQQPQVNVMVFPDGTTNIPHPKVHKAPSQKSPLETVVNLAVQRFEINNGLLEYAQQKTSLNARGENLHVLLNYDVTNPQYRGRVTIDPVLVTSPDRPELRVRVDLPVTIGKDAVTVAGGKFSTAQSQILIDASLHNLKAPVVSVNATAAISLPEFERKFPGGAPRTLNAKLAGRAELKNNVFAIEVADASLGRSAFHAAGTLEPSSGSSVAIRGNLALDEIGRLLNTGATKPGGSLELNGTAKLDAPNRYVIDGSLRSHGFSLRNETLQLSNIDLFSPFHADPSLISLNGLTIDALGGRFAAKVFIENLERLSVDGNLRNFGLSVLIPAITGKRLDYDGAINGSFTAKGNLKAKGASAYQASARLHINPGPHGVPMSGQINGEYSGSAGAVRLQESYLAMPHTRIDVSGSLNRHLDVHAISHDLRDFLPIANFGATQPVRTLPVTLEGGAAAFTAQVAGNLSAPRILGHLDVNRFAIERRSFDRLALDVSGSPSHVAVSNGFLTRAGLRSDFDASLGLRKWKPVPESALTANLTVRNEELADLLAMAGQNSIPASGRVGSDAHIHGTYSNPLGTVAFEVVDGSVYEQPFSRMYAEVNFADQLITLSPAELNSAAGSLSMRGTFRHPRESIRTGHAEFHVATNNVQLANITPLQQRNTGAAGSIELAADGAADLRTVNGQTETAVSNVRLDLTARGLRVYNQDAGNILATARTTNGTVNYELKSDFAGSDIRLNGHTALTNNYATNAEGSVRSLAVEKVLAITGQGAIPVRGNLSATAHVSGTREKPAGDLSLTLARANLYDEPVNRLDATLRYANEMLDISSLDVRAPAGRVTLHGSLNTRNAFDAKLRVDSTDIDLAKIEHARRSVPGLAGMLHLATDVSAELPQHGRPQDLRLKILNADIHTRDLRINARPLGDASLTARTAGTRLTFRLDSGIAQSNIRGEGETQLQGKYSTRASVTFSNIHYTNIAPFISETPEIKPGFDAVVEGQASLDGPVLDPDNLNARLQFDRADFLTNPQGSPTGGPAARKVEFHNDGPLIIALSHSRVQIQQFRIQGPRAFIEASGSVNFKDTEAPLAVKVTANADMGVLQDASRDIYSSGGITLDTTVRGTFASPQAVGKVELKNANLNYANAPNGLANANGVILLNGTNASIQSLTAESGGGKITLAGFVGYNARSMNFNLRATAAKVRTRYAGVSVTSNATISLIGSSRRSLLNGTVTVQRIAYTSSSDAGSILSSASTPPSTPNAPSPLLAGMRLNIKVLTDPSLRVVTSYAERLELSSNLTVRGTAANPGIVGAVRVTNGQLRFFGNTYTVNTGTVTFSNPNAIEPVLNISLETIAQGVDVLLGVSGPMNSLSLSYHSDPPLTFQQIVQLLATNTTPFDPTIAAHQPTPAQQSLSQTGESAILGQAVANPLASRVQRVFGFTQFKIDPSVAGGNNGQPTARVTLQQKIASNVTFTYITDVTQTNSVIGRVQWDFTPKFSALAVRDYNGNVSLQFLYKFKRR